MQVLKRREAGSRVLLQSKEASPQFTFRGPSCFSESGQPICGNGLVEQGEQCDCGYSDQCKDECCYDANQPEDKKCKLRPSKSCRYRGFSALEEASLFGLGLEGGRTALAYRGGLFPYQN